MVNSFNNIIRHSPFAIRHLPIAFCLLCALCPLYAEQCPKGYYDRIDGASDSILKGRLKAIIRNHTVIEYGDGSWEVFYYADRDENGYCMDMYCDDWKKFSSPGAEVSGCNVEHSFAKSWWGGAKNDAYKDCYHLNPSNSTANSSRSNYPPGIPVKDFKEKSKTGSLRVGKRHHDALNEDYYVFEPKDEYKGDFARTYFYMATCYGRDSLGNIDKTICSAYNGWRLDNNDVGSRYGMQNMDYLEFQPWLIEVLLDWHRKDPVSAKELHRMDAVSDYQHNRNPFIEYPCLAEYIWGNRKGQKVQLSSLKRTTDGNWLSLTDSLQLTGCQCDYNAPTLTTSTTQITFPAVMAETETRSTFHLIYALLPNTATLQISGDDADLYTVSPIEIAPTESKYVDSVITVAYRPDAVGLHSAQLVIACEGVDTLTISLQGTCTEMLPVTWLVDNQEYTAGSPTTAVIAGGNITALPTDPTSCCATSETFMGWADQPIMSTTDEAPATLYTKVSDFPNVEEPCIYYAVFAHHTQTGGGADVTQTATPASSAGWTVNAGSKSTSSYWVLSSSKSITSPEIDIASLKKIQISIRTYGGKQYSTVQINWDSSVISTLAGSSSTIHEYTWTNNTSLTGKGQLIFDSNTTTSDNGPGVSQIVLTMSGVKHTYSAYITTCTSTDLTATPYTLHSTPYTKVLKDGHLYILINDQTYNIQGQPVPAL